MAPPDPTASQPPRPPYTRMRGVRAACLIAFAATALLALAATPERAVDLVQRLGADRAAERDDAARQLEAMGRKAHPALRDAVETGPRHVRQRAQALLDLTESDEVARRAEIRGLVRAALRKPGGLEADNATGARLREIGDVAGPYLARRALAESEKGLVRPDLVESLGRHPSTESVTTLAALVRRGRVLPSSAIIAAHELRARRVDGQPHPGHAAALVDVRRTLVDSGGPLRRAATALLSALTDDVASLTPLLSDPYAGVRVEAARALGELEQISAGPPLRRAAEDSNPDVRRAALEALAKVPGRPYPQPAMNNAHHRVPAVRAAAAELLARDATPDALPLLDHLADHDPALRVRAAAQRSRAHLNR